MKTCFVRFICLFSAVLLLAFPAFAKAGMDASVYSFSDDDPVVHTAEVFRAVYEEEKDIEIRGTRASFYFYYENIIRSTDKWHDFSTKITVAPAEIPALKEALSNTPAYFIDFRDGDSYPGTTEITVRVSDVTGDGPFLLYGYAEDENGVPVLEPIAKSLSPDGDGMIRLTVSSALDCLLITADKAPSGLDAYIRSITITTGGFFSGASLVWIIFGTVVGLLLILLIGYLVTVKLLKRKQQKQKALTAAKKKK